MDSVDDVLLDSEEKMEASFEHLRAEFAGIRTGKASPALVEHVNVAYYGTQTRLRELASISTPEPRLLVINPYDPTALQAIEKAILSANLGITPMNDGRIIRIPIPELSGERRVEIAKIAKRAAEETRVSIRGDRRAANDAVKALQKKGDITEDDREEILKQIQETTDGYIRKVDELLEAKEKEIMSV
ncbi:MAG: ribosome recycling factor [Kiritimatiellae bacterium]|nr:ribosome recycling factor [Kiritimatiellia bacterium]